jgi:hypothetical protein
MEPEAMTQRLPKVEDRPWSSLQAIQNLLKKALIK